MSMSNQTIENVRSILLGAVEEARKLAKQKMLDQLPPPVQQKVQALKKLQLQTIDLDAEFQLIVYDLEQKFHARHKEIYLKRKEIISGIYEPTNDECILPKNCKTEELNNKVNVKKEIENKDDAAGNKTIGIPNFWINVLKFNPMFETEITDEDEKILQHLTNIELILKPLPDMSFIIEFHFSPNSYFENSILYKEYFMTCSPEAENPFSFDGPFIYKANGCEIQFKPEYENYLQSETFFRFFKTLQLPPTDHPNFSKISKYMEADFEIGFYLKERIIPKAVLYFTGEIDDNDEFETDDEEDEEDDENNECTSSNGASSDCDGRQSPLIGDGLENC